jgi:site-specific recombinase XerD
MDDLVRDFALSLTAEGKKPKTVKIYTDAARWLQRSQGIGDWRGITRSQVRRHVAWIVENRSKAYASNQYRALQQFFKFLEAEEDIPNPMSGMKPPTVPEKLVPVIPASDWERLIDSITGRRFLDIRDRAVFMFFRSTGARRSEVANIRVTDIDLDQLAAIVTGKASRMRIVRFDAATGLSLTRYLRARSRHKHAASEMLWIGVDGPLHPDAFNLLFQRRSDKAGVKINPHRFRHDFSHRYLLNGGQEGDLMQQNGWGSREMADRYGASAAAERARHHYDGVMQAQAKATVKN